MKIVKSIAYLFVLFGAFSMPAGAIEAFKIDDISIEGLQRVESATVFNYLPFKVGEQANDANVNSATQALYSTGLFTDVVLSQRGGTLVVKVVERPFIASVTFGGNNEFQTDELKKALREMGFAEGRAYDKSLLARAEQELKRMYLARSKYGLKINSIASPIERNRVNVRMEFDEGDIARIKKIKILGNSKFSETDLLEQLSQRTPSWASWLTRSDRYAKEKLSADLEVLNSFYKSQGYFDFAIESNQVSLSPDKQDVTITVVIKEGDQYRFGPVIVKTALPKQAETLQKLVIPKEGEIFNAETLNQSIQLIQNQLGENGFANALITPATIEDINKRIIGFDLNVEPGSRTYVRKVVIQGNSTTRDSVVRREIRQLEAAPYDAAKIKLSRDRIDRLGYFKEVNFDTLQVEGRPDQIDLVYNVVEKGSTTYSFGLGFNSTDKVSITAGITQDNIFGTGNNLSFNINTGRSTRGFSLSALDPYFTESGISRSFDLYSRLDKQTENGASKVDVKTKGLAVKFGFPMSESNTVYVGLGGESTGITSYAGNTPPRYTDLESAIDKSATYPLATLNWTKDDRDSAINPNRGSYYRIASETALGSEIAFSKIGYQYQYFKPISRDYTFAANLDLGYAQGIRGKDLPFFKNYFVGGLGSVRGYEGGTLGPTETYTNAAGASKTDHIGGAKKLVVNTELLFPFPGTGRDRSLRAFVFADGGYSWDEKDNFNLSNLRYSTGIGFSWVSPIGPLKFSYGIPIKRQASDKPQRLQFQIGTGF